VGCIAGALSIGEYEEGLRAAGLEDVTVTLTHQVADGMHSAIVKATKSKREARAQQLPVLASTGGSCC
jgi:hypothetical protein